MARLSKSVMILVSPNFFNALDNKRISIQKKIGFKKNITHAQITDMMMRSKQFKLPELNIDFLKNVKRKKRCIN